MADFELAALFPKWEVGRKLLSQGPGVSSIGRQLEKMPDPGPVTHMVVSTKANRGVAYGKPEKLKLVNITA